MSNIRPQPVSSYSRIDVVDYASFRSLINKTNGKIICDYLDESNILVINELEYIITELDQCIQEEVQGVIALSEKKSAKFKSAVDRLDKLRLDLYNDRLL